MSTVFAGTALSRTQRSTRKTVIFAAVIAFLYHSTSIYIYIYGYIYTCIYGYIYVYIYICLCMLTKLQIEHWNPNSNVKVFRPRNNVSRHAQTFPPGHRILQEIAHRLRGLELKKKQNECLDLQPMPYSCFSFSIRSYYIYGAA